MNLVFIFSMFAFLAPGAEVEQILNKMQALYEKTSSYAAEFEQTYFSAAFPEPQQSSGKLYFRKPGLMRWEYEKPEKKLFVCDGSSLYLYEPAYNQVMVSEGIDRSGLSTALLFLFGKGNLGEEFDAKIAAQETCGQKGDVALLFTPRRDAGNFQSLCMAIDPKSFQVKESALTDAFGNLNRLRFLSPRINPKLDEKLFKFETPAGVNVIRASQ